jgi:hypothetical protein
LIGAYFISEGIAYRYMRLHKISYHTFDRFYHPVVWLNKQGTFLSPIIEWNENLWYSEIDEDEKFFQQAFSSLGITSRVETADSTNHISESCFVVMAFIVIAIGLIFYFVSKQFLFRRHKRSGEEALQRGDYRAAIQSFARAETFWELNVTKQTIPSYRYDLAKLDELLKGLEAAARSGGITLAVDEYRDAVKAVQAELQGNEAGKRVSTGKTYASALTRLKHAQSALREQLRANQTRQP